MKTALLLCLGLFALSLNSPIAWQGPTTYEMGDIIHQDSAVHDFVFKNVSGQALTIDNVRPSCGCTGTVWSQAPVPPDSTGTIRVVYDARDLGYFNKKIKVYFSGQRRAEVLFIEGWVVEL